MDKTYAHRKKHIFSQGKTHIFTEKKKMHPFVFKKTKT